MLESNSQVHHRLRITHVNRLIDACAVPSPATVIVSDAPCIQVTSMCACLCSCLHWWLEWVG
jgi:hypothetical protein